MKVLLLSDVPGWIVDRCSKRMVAGMPDFEFIECYYTCVEPDEFVRLGMESDLVHYQNWDLGRNYPALLKLKEAGKPVLISVRSHRFPPVFREQAKNFYLHAVSPSIQAQFPNSHYIPDGLMIEPRPLRVGFAGKVCAYKGTDLIERACREIGAQLEIATNLDPAEMCAFYDRVDVVVCASENEGFGAIAMEALALNKPVVSTRCGAAWESQMPGVTWVDRTLDGIKGGLLTHWPSRHLLPFTWEAACGQFRDLYRKLCST